VIDAVRFIARNGHRFLARYRFDPMTGAWEHEAAREPLSVLSLAEALEAGAVRKTALPAEERARRYAALLVEAQRLAEGMDAPEAKPGQLVEDRFGALQFFST
jgi:hypothetical protein